MGELLSWFGNFMNFTILVYFYIRFIRSPGSESDMWIATFGLVIAVLIQIYNLTEKW